MTAHEDIYAAIERQADEDGQFAIAYAILQLATAQQDVADALQKDGALDFLAATIREALDGVADAIKK